ncbi:hypothetical protein N7492_000583 [Penicillium capsulatum]|uniref:Telomeric single stranded DNA binding POT1/Cdc13 domain-containing protein n=1 Tax=Penicillium capsulatum TaxID=69766 RepID=A0A9W9IS61_9EURO|nr:hypothetical protein N7492_000583 [Penicillium capsulatum]KAJ6130359.1 hypothetical protein N7512_003139 [Penicillium capsulatum]
MDATNSPSNALPHFTKVPIAQLSPDLEHQEVKGITAAVTLVWPYSSSTKSLSLLLAEPDFRLRRSHGQVKAIFHGRVAEEVAGSHVGIGDTVRLSLKGASYAGNDIAAQTPGRYVAWDVHFTNGVSLGINRSEDSPPTVIVAEYTEPQEPELPPPATPRTASTKPQANETVDQTTWQSPAFSRSSPNNFGGLLGSQFDPFAEDDGFVPGKGRKRPRYSFQRADWRVLDDPLSPQESEEKDSWERESWEKTPEEDLEEQIDQEPEPTKNAQFGIDAPISEVPREEQEPSTLDAPRDESPVFVKPSLELASNMFGRRAPELNTTNRQSAAISQHANEAASHLPTDTPQLRPIPSPGLPIPSPIVSGQSNNQGYFGSFHTVSRPQFAQPVLSELSPQTQLNGFGLHDEISLVSEPPSTLEDGLNVASTHPEGETISDPRNLRDDAILGAPPLETPHDLNQVPLGTPGALEPPYLGHEHNLAQPAVQSTIGGHTEARSDDGDYNSISSRSDIEDSDAEEDAQDEHNNDDAAMDSEESGDEFTGERIHEESHLHPGIATAAQAVAEMGTPEEQESPTFENVPNPTDTSGFIPTRDNYRIVQRRNEESDASDEEDLDGHDGEPDYSSQYDYDDDGEDEVQAEESSDDESESAPLPPQQPSQPEIIILDNDSEDELASDQPVPPQPALQQNDPNRGSFIMSASADVEAEEDEDDWPLSEAGTSTADAEFQHPNDRVDDSDLAEDESSVDVLAQGHTSEQASAQRNPFEEEIIDDVESAGDLQGDHGLERAITSEASSDLNGELDEVDDEAIRETEMSPRQDESPASPPLRDTHMPRGITRTYSAFDGASDQDRLRNARHDSNIDEADIDRAGLEIDKVPAAGQQHNEAEVQVANDLPVFKELDSIGAVEQQLPTPDPTQEKVSGHAFAFQQEHDAVSVQSNTQAPSFGLNISFDSSQGAPVDQTKVTNEIPQETASDQNLDNVKGHSTSLPVIDSTEKDDVPPFPTRGKPSQAAAVIVSNPPGPNRDAHGLRTKYAYFAPLGAVVDHYNALVDTISIVNEVSPIARATSGPKDYYVTIQLTDPSMAGTLLQAQIFRKYKSALPSLSEGDAVLLRDFKVRSYDHSIILVSVDSSSWAVFDGASPDAQVNGPPVEYGPQERAYSSGLRRWYTEIGADTVADYHLQAMIEKDNMDRESSPGSVMGSDVGSIDSSLRSDMTPSARSSRRSRRSHRRVTIHELRDGRRYTEVGSPSSKESIHELRDGTVYANL